LGPVLGIIACLLVLVPVLDLHPPGEAHDPLVALGQSQHEVYYPGASHPLAPQHAEAAEAAHRPICPACLNRLQTGGAHQARPVPLPTPRSAERVAAAGPVLPVERAVPAPGARGPPPC
jgi:hypothetical protein